MKDFDQIKDSIETLNAEQISLHAHAMKGAASFLSAENLRQIAESIEMMGRNSEFENIQNQLDCLREEIENCLSYLGQQEDLLSDT